MLSHFSRVQLFVTTWTVARQAPLSMEFSRQEYWSGLPCPPPEDLLNLGIKPVSLTFPALQAGSLVLAPPVQEPQASSAFRTPTAGSLQSWDRRVRPRLV